MIVDMTVPAASPCMALSGNGNLKGIEDDDHLQYSTNTTNSNSIYTITINLDAPNYWTMSNFDQP